MTVQLTATVRTLGDGGAVFEELASWYHVPPHLMPILRTAKDTRREVRITTDRTCTIYTAELAPVLPLLVRLRNKVAELRIRVQLWSRGWGR
jgi:hypothetical protein